MVEKDNEGEYLVLECPHCAGGVKIYLKEINCTIFRHGILKSNGKQINPHLSKDQCDLLREEGKIHGCAKPFKIIKKEGEYHIEECDYI